MWDYSFFEQVKAREVSHQVSVSSESPSLSQSAYDATETTNHITGILVRGLAGTESGNTIYTALITHCEAAVQYINVAGPSPAQIWPLVGKASQSHLVIADLLFSSMHLLLEIIAWLDPPVDWCVFVLMKMS
jgi:hypothetical protein